MYFAFFFDDLLKTLVDVYCIQNVLYPVVFNVLEKQYLTIFLSYFKQTYFKYFGYFLGATTKYVKRSKFIIKGGLVRVKKLKTEIACPSNSSVY